MQYLVIFNGVPDYIKVYHFSELSKEDAAKLEACNNKYINSENWPEEDWLSKFLDAKKPLQHPIKIPASAWDIRIIETGFIM